MNCFIKSFPGFADLDVRLVCLPTFQLLRDMHGGGGALTSHKDTQDASTGTLSGRVWIQAAMINHLFCDKAGRECAAARQQLAVGGQIKEAFKSVGE